MPVLAAAQELLDEGMEKTEVAARLEVPSDTLRKALADGRLVVRPRAVALDKSAHSVEDASAATGMGTACTWVVERVLASLGKLDGAPVRFEPYRNVSYGGVLCALPALPISWNNAVGFCPSLAPCISPDVRICWT